LLYFLVLLNFSIQFTGSHLLPFSSQMLLVQGEGQGDLRGRTGVEMAFGASLGFVSRLQTTNFHVSLIMFIAFGHS